MCVCVCAGFKSVELRPVAAVSVLLYSDGEQLQVRGPIQISLPLGHDTRLRAADTVPAWAFNLQTGETAVKAGHHEMSPNRTNSVRIGGFNNEIQLDFSPRWGKQDRNPNHINLSLIWLHTLLPPKLLEGLESRVSFLFP